MIFDLLSSDTHAFDPVATAVLRELGDDPVDESRVFGALALTFGCPRDPDLKATILAALENLERLGLAERIPL